MCLVTQSCLILFATPWIIAHQAPLSMGILQASILEWVALPSSRGSSQLTDWTQVSCIAGEFFTILATREVQSIYSVYLWSIETKVIPIKKQFSIMICVNWSQTLYVKLRSMTSILNQNYMILETEEQLYNAQCINKELSLGKEEWETKPDYHAVNMINYSIICYNVKCICQAYLRCIIL